VKLDAPSTATKICAVRRSPGEPVDHDRHAVARFRKFWSLISAVGEQRLQKWKHAEQCRHHENAAIAILNVGRMNDGVEQETYCVDKNVPLLALDLSATPSLSLLARIVAVRINARPRLRSVLIGEHLEMLGVADFLACIDIDPVSETGPTSGLKFPRFPESDFKIFGALRSMMIG
jgi:hypothetical protein